jgi:lauroyl/myristoyl acyltransferase
MRRIARNQMAYVLGSVRPDADLDRVALRHIDDMFWKRELRWRPREQADQEVAGVDNLTKAHPEHGGMLLGFLHHGRYDGIFGALVAHGARPMTIVGGEGIFQPDPLPHFSAMRVTAEQGGTLVPTSLGYAGLRDLVLAGETVAVALDLPGSTRVRFLGRDLLAASGTARIAMETQAPVVVVSAWQHDRRQQRIEVSQPIQPGDHPDAGSLLQAMFDVLEPSVLAWPEAYEWPRAHFVELDEAGEPIAHERDPGEPSFA